MTLSSQAKARLAQVAEITDLQGVDPYTEMVKLLVEVRDLLVQIEQNTRAP